MSWARPALDRRRRPTTGRAATGLTRRAVDTARRHEGSPDPGQPRPRRHGLDHPEELSDVDGLGEIGGHADVAESLDLRRGGVGGHHDDGDLLGTGIGLERVEQVGPRHVGEVEVEEDQMGSVLTSQFDAEAPRHRRQQLHETRTGEDLLDQFEVGEVVLDVQDPQRGDTGAARRARPRGGAPGPRVRSAVGRSTVKVVPSPSFE